MSQLSQIPLTDAEDWYTPDEHLRWLARRAVGDALWPVAEGALQEAGRLVPTRIEPLSRLADRHPPVLHQYDARGERVDEIEFHPAYREIEDTEHRFGLVRMAYMPGWRGLQGRAPRSLVTALNYLFLQADQAICGCPVGMTDAMCRTLELHDPQLAERFLPGLADDGGRHLSGAMFMTEKAGGSDVGANQTRAVRQADGTWRLHGDKWFCSNAAADLALVLARPEGAGPGTKGLGLFLMPRRLEDGRRNSYRVNRLKEKFGTRAMASGEITLEGAFAWPVGSVELGMKQMLDMVNLTRVGIANTTAAAMRRAAFESLEHSRRRAAFGKPLDQHPLMRDTLAELVVDATAGLTAAMAGAEALDAADAGRPGATGVLRLLTPLFKGLGAERARLAATEAMEVRGGNGYIEDWPNSRLLRDVYVHAIWEGSGNVVALDVLRALGHGAGPDLFADLERRAEASGTLAGPLLNGLRRAQEAAARLDGEELPARRLARRLATTAAAIHLGEKAREHAQETGSGRLLWIAARYAARLGGEAAVAAVADDPAWLEHAPALLHGGPVPAEVGEWAAKAAAAALG